MKTAAIMLVLALTACGKKTEEKPAATGSATPTAVAPADAPAVAVAPAPPAAEPVDVPTEVDFEDTASTEITDKNVEARLKAIETDLTE